MREDEPDYNKASNLISTDVGLSAAMLKTVNSPFFGLRTKATAVGHYEPGRGSYESRDA